MLIFQIILMVVLVSCALGPFGHQWALESGGPDFILIATWAFCWFTDRKTTWRWVLLAGLALDTLLYTPFGVWTFSLALVALLIEFLQARLLEVSSFAHALFALVLVSTVANLLIAIATSSFDLRLILTNIFANALVGVVVYYGYGLRLNLFTRWAGKRL